MNRIVLSALCLAVLGIAFSFSDQVSVSAARATPDKGQGCFVRVGEGPNDYELDATCEAHEVLKLDNQGNVEFYVYQDHGQLPEGSWRPDTTFRDTFEQCFNTSFGQICGIATETVTPSGEYKSNFKSY